MEVFRLQGLQEKILGIFSRFMRPITKLFAMKLRRILEVFQEKDLGAFSRFIRPQTKLFATKFRRVVEVIRLQVYRKVLGTFS